MHPSINAGDFVMFYRLDRSCEPGDVVVVDGDKRSGGRDGGRSGSRSNRRELYRVIACGGDSVEIIKNDEIFVNGMILDIGHDFVGSLRGEDGRSEGNIRYPYNVPDDAMFLLGDNRDEWTDSRMLGAFSADKIKGKVISILRTRGM